MKDKPCECTEAGWCERHQCYKTAHWVELCRTNAKYRAAWDKGVGPGQRMSLPEADGKPRKKSGGPGTELRRFLGCGCSMKRHRAEMDKWGVDGCREQFEQIVAWMRGTNDEAGTRFSDSVARRILNYVIERAATRDLEEKK